MLITLKIIWLNCKQIIFGKNLHSRNLTKSIWVINKQKEEWREIENLRNQQKKIENPIRAETKTRLKQRNQLCVEKNFRTQFSIKNFESSWFVDKEQIAWSPIKVTLIYVKLIEKNDLEETKAWRISTKDSFIISCRIISHTLFPMVK